MVSWHRCHAGGWVRSRADAEWSTFDRRRHRPEAPHPGARRCETSPGHGGHRIDRETWTTYVSPNNFTFRKVGPVTAVTVAERPRNAGRPSQREEIISAALARLRRGETVSLASAADAVGLSKPGLMYHFDTKEALITAMVDRVLDCYEERFRAQLSTSIASATARERMYAYVQVAVEGNHDGGDLVMMSDPKLRLQMTERWTQRLGKWTEIPTDLSAAERQRLLAVRLLADGLWFADAAGLLPPSRSDRSGLVEVARQILDGSP
jgi:AcrR family transcriptional regulator